MKTLAQFVHKRLKNDFAFLFAMAKWLVDLRSSNALYRSLYFMLFVVLFRS